MSASRAFDTVLMLGALGAIAASAAFRFTGTTLTPYSWMPAALAAITLTITFAWRLVPR